MKKEYIDKQLILQALDEWMDDLNKQIKEVD